MENANARDSGDCTTRQPRSVGTHPARPLKKSLKKSIEGSFPVPDHARVPGLVDDCERPGIA